MPEAGTKGEGEILEEVFNKPLDGGDLTGNTDEKVNKDHLFQKGEDPRRNLEGRPKGARNLSTMLAEALKQRSKRPDGSLGETYEDLLIKRIIEKAVAKGDNRIIELIYDRLEGKAPQFLDITTDGESLNPEAKKKADDAIAAFLSKKTTDNG